MSSFTFASCDLTDVIRYAAKKAGRPESKLYMSSASGFNEAQVRIYGLQ